jgi:translation initiation factor IF-2
MSESAEERIAQTQPAFSGRPPAPPKITARGLEDDDDDSGKTIHIPDTVAVKELAAKLALRPFKVVGDLLELGEFKYPEDNIDFETAWLVAKKHGFNAVRQSTPFE